MARRSPGSCSVEELRAAAEKLVSRSCREQSIPLVVEDVAVLARIAVLVADLCEPAPRVRSVDSSR
jgi:hypothetical protein